MEPIYAIEAESAQTLATRCRLLEYDKSFNRGVLFFLETEYDFSVFRRFVDLNLVRFIICRNKQIALDTHNLYIVQEGRCPAICVVDADTDHILNRCHQQNVFVTDDSDLDLMIFNSSAFDDLNSRFTFPVSISEARKIIFKKCYLLGKLRLINVVEDWRISFDRAKSIFFHPDYNCENLDDVLSVIEQDNLNKFAQHNVREKFKNHPMLTHDYLRGHDVYIAAEAYLKSIGVCVKGGITQDLSKLYDSADFRKTKLFKSLVEWTVQNNTPLFKSELLV
jgi:hypothetical protein